ncbi:MULTISPECIES: hypothetical protein [unclassified Streptomyces]|uniref:hypothetical protein n=1 Tax=unclassified Streptomyces TaxID=2593676 RepID=UPI00340F468E
MDNGFPSGDFRIINVETGLCLYAPRETREAQRALRDTHDARDTRAASDTPAAPETPGGQATPRREPATGPTPELAIREPQGTEDEKWCFDTRRDREGMAPANQLVCAPTHASGGQYALDAGQAGLYATEKDEARAATLSRLIQAEEEQARLEAMTTDPDKEEEAVRRLQELAADEELEDLRETVGFVGLGALRAQLRLARGLDLLPQDVAHLLGGVGLVGADTSPVSKWAAQDGALVLEDKPDQQVVIYELPNTGEYRPALIHKKATGPGLHRTWRFEKA